MERLLEDPITGQLTYEKVTDIAPVINANDDLQKDGTNGFTPERGYRQVGSIPAEVFQKMARETGYYSMGREDRRTTMMSFLSKHPEFRTVEHLVTKTGNDGNLIIR